MPIESINLIPPQQIRWTVLLQTLGVWGKIWLALIIISSAIWLQQYLVLKNLSVLVSDWETRSRPARMIAEQNQIQMQQINTLASQLEVYLQLETHPPHLAVLGHLGQEVTRCAGRVELRHVSMHDTRATEHTLGEAVRVLSARSQSFSAHVGAIVRIEGLADSSRTTTLLVSSLKRCELFENVTLVSTQSALHQGTPYLSYLVECHLAECERAECPPKETP